MLIRIFVIQFRGSTPATNQAYIFDERGGSIGREEGNQLILRDDSRILSRVQAQIQFVDGQFRLLDHGGNPSLVNGLRVGKGNSRVLYDGDIIELGEYKLRAKVIGSTEESPANPAAELGTDSDSLDMSIHLDVEFEELSTIVPRSTLLEAAPEVVPEVAKPASVPQLLAALCKGLSLGSIPALPASLDASMMQNIGDLLSRALHTTVAQLAERNPAENANPAALQAIFLKALQAECLKLDIDSSRLNDGR